MLTVVSLADAHAQNAPPESGGRNNRRYERFAVNFKATLIQGKKTIRGRVVDISFTGLFFATLQVPPLRDLVKIDLELPTGATMRVLGMAVHAVRPKHNTTLRAGVGVQLFGNGPDVRAQWDDFVNAVRTSFLSEQTEDERNGRPTDDRGPPSPDDPRFDEAPVERLPTDNIAPLLDAAEIEQVVDRLYSTDLTSTDRAPVGPPALTEASAERWESMHLSDPLGPLPADPSAPPSPTSRRGPGRVGGLPAPSPRARLDGPRSGASEDLCFDVAKPELRVRIGSLDALRRLRTRQQLGQPVFFRTEVCMEPNTPLQIRIMQTTGETVFVSEGRVIESSRPDARPGLWVQLNDIDVAPSEDIYITIDLDGGWSDGPG